MASRKVILVVVLLLLATLVGGTIYAAVTDEVTHWNNVGKEMKEAKKIPNSTAVVATINGEPVTKGDFAASRTVMRSLGMSPGTVADVLSFITEKRVILQEAERRGLQATREETLEQMKTYRETIRNAEARGYEVDQRSKAEWEAYLAGLGMTDDEYWRNEEVIKAYQAGIAISKLRFALAEEWGYTRKDLSDPDTLTEFESRFADFVKSLAKQAKVEIIERNELEVLCNAESN